jgi:fructokinase
VDLSLVFETDAPTTLAVAALDQSGSAAYQFYLTGTSAFGLSEPPAGALDAAEALYVGSLGLVIRPMADTIAEMVVRAPARLLVMIDPNCRPQAVSDPDAYATRLGAVFARADVVRVSRDDLAYLFPGSLPERAAREVAALGPRVVLLTDGGAGVRIISAGSDASLPVSATEVVDTVGAGDAFGGAFLAWWVAHGLGRDKLDDAAALREATASAIEVARLTTMHRGAYAPTADEVRDSAQSPTV